jgi:3'-5' exoribonuclease
MTDRLFIRDLGPNQLIEGLFAIQNCQLGLTRNGKPYLKCLIADKTGRLPGRMWNTTEQFVQSLPTDGFVRIEGQTQPYQGQLQLILNHVEAATPEPGELTALLPATENDIDAMYEQVAAIVRSISHDGMRALAEAYLQDAKLMEAFRQAPAAVQLHHAYLGGLLEHTLSLLQLAEAMLPLLPGLNRDLILLGLFVHDLGKCAELTWRKGFAYTDDGQLVGHIARGVMWLERKAELCAKAGHELPRPALMVLEHIILSHHGRPEFGAAKLPATPEALFVSMLDNLDAKMQMALGATRAGAEADAELNGHFTDKVWALDNVRLYRPDPLRGDPAAAPPDEHQPDHAP